MLRTNEVVFQISCSIFTLDTTNRLNTESILCYSKFMSTVFANNDKCVITTYVSIRHQYLKKRHIL